MQTRYKLKPVQILLVQHSEDEATGIKYALDKLELYYELSWARNAEEAISVLKERTIRKLIPDLVLIDDELPGSNGRLLLNDIRKENQWKHFPCFLLVVPERSITSGSPGMEGLSGCINKPFSINGLAKSGSLNLMMDLINSSNYRKL